MNARNVLLVNAMVAHARTHGVDMTASARETTYISRRTIHALVRQLYSTRENVCALAQDLQEAVLKNLLFIENQL